MSDSSPRKAARLIRMTAVEGLFSSPYVQGRMASGLTSGAVHG